MHMFHDLQSRHIYMYFFQVRQISAGTGGSDGYNGFLASDGICTSPFWELDITSVCFEMLVMLCNNISFIVIDLELDTTINVGVVFLMPKDYLLVWLVGLGWNHGGCTFKSS